MVDKNWPDGWQAILFIFFQYLGQNSFFIIEYGTRNHEDSFTIRIFPIFTALGTPGYPKMAQEG